jgi:para-aminobenzoate synthetase component 1
LGDFSLLAFAACEMRSFPSEATEDFSLFLNDAFSIQKQCEQTVMPDFLPKMMATSLWLGFISYEAYALNPTIPFKPRNLPTYPLAVFRHYENFIFTDHRNNKTFFISHAENGEKIYRDLQKKSHTEKSDLTWEIGLAKANRSANAYADDFLRVKNSLEKGDFLELNHTFEFTTPFSGSSLGAYLTLRQIAPAPMMTYLAWPEVTILSASPECFFKITNRKIQTFPIKGTRKRFSDPMIDDKMKGSLMSSAKDQAELLMITDMLRSDLGRLCATGSVVVDQLFSLHSFSHYHHLIAEISGHLKKDQNLSDVFLSLFPGGSITGAPKIEVIKNIDALENRARGIYTGALGLIGNDCAQFSIPIRTIVIENQSKVISPPARELKYAVGSGIVADSECEAEYQECLVKASGIFQALKKGQIAA